MGQRGQGHKGICSLPLPQFPPALRCYCGSFRSCLGSFLVFSMAPSHLLFSCHPQIPMLAQQPTPCSWEEREEPLLWCTGSLQCPALFHNSIPRRMASGSVCRPPKAPVRWLQLWGSGDPSSTHCPFSLRGGASFLLFLFLGYLNISCLASQHFHHLFVNSLYVTPLVQESWAHFCFPYLTLNNLALKVGLWLNF